MTHGSLFSGLGTWNYAADMLGWKTVFNCEINKFCETILKYYWPDADYYNDINETDFTRYANKIDVLSLSCPCQPFSIAGKRKGSRDDRHLWPQGIAAIRAINPIWVCYENVPGISHIENGMAFERVSLDLENEGYETAPALIIPACAKDAVHRRDRIWIVAHSTSAGSRSQSRNIIHEGRSFGKSGGTGVQKNSEWENGSAISNDRTTNTDASHSRLQRQAKHEQQTAGIEQCITDDTENNNERDAWIQERKSSEVQKQIRGHNSNGITWNNENWLEAATRLCVLDVQSATGLDSKTFQKETGMSFSKWRTESLKALGNTIMWEVALEIFKSIEQTTPHKNIPAG